MAERGYRHLNTSALRQISKALEQDPAADIEATLRKVYTSYSSLRRSVEERQAKRKGAHNFETESKEVQATTIESPVPPALRPLASTLNPHGTDDRQFFRQLLDSPISYPCAFPLVVVHPLSPVVEDLVGLSDDHSLSPKILWRVLGGTTLWEQFSRAVIKIGDDVVVKVAQRLDPDEHGVLRYVEEHFPSIPAPRPLKLVTIAQTSFMFMSLIPGETLEKRWPSLPAESKIHVQKTLNQHLLALRQYERPQSGTSAVLGCPVGRQLCKDVRREERVSTTIITDEMEFNNFLVHSPSSRAAPRHKNWLHSLLRADHRIVFTHADLHPRIVMVVDAPDGSVEVSGIIDWEASGFYPEYWEQLKAVNTCAITDTSDWWDHLPPSILGYDQELVLDRVIDSTILR